ncbi:MAG: ABC transporter ATP-binding protein [Bacillaceae bacterium]|nr:ABC transporter ATP-binding protein [Bacillaceae bacterium]
MAAIELKDVSKRFGNQTVIRNLNLWVEDGSFTVLVGPSGCGKSTTLRMIAGLEQVSDGEIRMNGDPINHLPPGKRDVAMVFQNYALYPTMTVRENIEFGLKNKKVPKKERQQLIEEITAVVGLEAYLDRKPSTLSGGQRQRVALARAMVKKPKVFLMDEPLSNLDAKLRAQMRTELIELHKKLGTTFIYVTHDQVEAMSMGDKIVIMNEGEIQQATEPMEIYQQPANLFTALFIGTPPMNIIEKDKIPQLHSHNKDIVYVGFRPEKVVLSNEPLEGGLTLPAEIVNREILGHETIYQMEMSGIPFKVKHYDHPLEEGMRLFAYIAYKNLYFFDREGRRMEVEENKADLQTVAGGVRVCP